MADQQGKGIPILPEAEAVAARAKLRDALKAEFRKQLSHPYRYTEPGYIFDPAIQRFSSMKVSYLDHFRVTPRTTKYGLIPTIGVLLGLAWILDEEKTKREHLYRTGQIAYKDRQFKLT